MVINHKDISVIIPLYNSIDNITRVLDAINSQTYSNFLLEIIIVNDGSTDNPEIVLNDYINSISKIPIRLINKENGGVSSARNLGMKESKGKWIAFCDSDDIWFKEKIEKQVKIINKLGDVDLIGGNHTEKTIKILGKEINELHKANVKELCIKMFPQTSTILMCKSIYEKIGGFDENQKYAEDGNYFVKVAYNYNYYFIPEQLISYGDGKRGFGESGLSKNLKEMQKGTLKNIKDFYQEGIISKSFYYFLYVFYVLKYIRRIIISKIT